MSASHDRALDALARRGRLRTLERRAGLDFTSNDYLGLAESEALAAALRAALDRGVPVGAAGSRLLRGNHDEHDQLETEAAGFFRAQSALFMAGGFAANTALFSTLPSRGDLIIHDELIHASTHEGMRLSKADSRAARHNDAGDVERIIRGWRTDGGRGQIWIAIESLYSMDGDCAPLDDLIAVANTHDAMLVIDEAHATGVFGPEGRGLAAHLEGRDNVLSVHTCGKALGVMGALIVGPKLYRDVLINRARNFIYATAPSPLIAATVRAALNLVARSDDRRSRLLDLIAHANHELSSKTRFEPSGSQILPLLTGTDSRAVALGQSMKARGYDVRAIRPPTVPEGAARLRMTVTLNTDADKISAFVADLAAADGALAA
jgi:8-amino-7-oxononanoate synthase